MDKLVNYSVTSETLLGAKVQLTDGSRTHMEVPLVQGMAYVTAKYTNTIPRIATQHAILSVNQTGNVAQIELNNGQEWRAYILGNDGTPDFGFQFEQDLLANGRRRLQAAQPFTGVIRLALITNPEERQIFDAHAGAYTRGRRECLPGKSWVSCLRCVAHWW